MIYIIGTIYYANGTSYRCFEVHTESIFTLSTNELCRLIDRGARIENATIANSSVSLENCINNIHSENNGSNSGANYILLCKIAKDEFKLVDFNGNVTYREEKKLNRKIKSDRVVNCKIENEKMISLGTYTVKEDKEFNSTIAEKYKIYTAKTALLGKNMSFKYKIEGKQVKLYSYTGTSKTVIIPKFITSIMENAFLYCDIEELTLDNGLTHIGTSAFQGCSIGEVTIPETAQFIGQWAFYENKKLTTGDGNYKSSIKISNKETIIIN